MFEFYIVAAVLLAAGATLGILMAVWIRREERDSAHRDSTSRIAQGARRTGSSTRVPAHQRRRTTPAERPTEAAPTAALPLPSATPEPDRPSELSPTGGFPRRIVLWPIPSRPSRCPIRRNYRKGPASAACPVLIDGDAVFMACGRHTPSTAPGPADEVVLELRYTHCDAIDPRPRPVRGLPADRDLSPDSIMPRRNIGSAPRLNGADGAHRGDGAPDQGPHRHRQARAYDPAAPPTR
jgi:hypothetical protein